MSEIVAPSLLAEWFTPLWVSVYIPDGRDPFDEVGLCVGIGGTTTPHLTKDECLEEVARALITRTVAHSCRRPRPLYWAGTVIHIIVAGGDFIASYKPGEWQYQDPSEILWTVAEMLRGVRECSL